MSTALDARAPAPLPQSAAPGSHDERVREHARALGFDVVAFARADEPLGVEHARYEAFVAAGMHGEMRHLAEHREVRRRLDVEGILAGAKSVICVGKRYARASDGDDPELARSVARYARGFDYHRFLKKRLRRLARFVAALAEGARARALCDIEPVLERAWAARAGLGFVGKHGLVITPGQGSYQILGEVVTTLELVPGTPMTERCGACTRCLDACPTSAFVAPFVLDPRRCIAYLNIEADSTPPPELRELMGEKLFGCDECQEACPFNRAAPPPASATADFAPSSAWEGLTLDALVSMEAPAWDAALFRTPLKRARRERLARSAVLVAYHRARRLPDDPTARATLAAGLVHEDAGVRALARELEAALTREAASSSEPTS